MTFKKLFSLLCVVICQLILAQNDSIVSLNEVVISDLQLKKYSNSQNTLNLSDSLLSKNQPSLTSVLNHNSTIYFKENGFGMVSSPSFRGTTAQQTAVVWNGININSQLNGQTDFNTISTKNFDNIIVRAGGGSAIYGSSAIGGSIHLNNDLSFKDLFQNDLQINKGSFNTLGIHYDVKVGNKKFSSQFGFSLNSSDNDYLYLKKFDWKGNQLKNLNGEFLNTDYNVNFGYKLDNRNIIKLYSQTSVSDRNFSLITVSDTKTKYINTFNRNLLDYFGNFKSFSINFKTAYLFEDYKYFVDFDNNYFSQGSSESLIAKLDVGFSPIKSLQLNTVFDYNQTSGYGASFGSNKREISSIGLFAKHELTKKWLNEFVIRKEITNNYQSPTLFSIGSVYTFNTFYSLKINGSRNFRIPTFNDLYWQNGGNLNLKPESSYQAEIGNVFKYRKFNLSQTFYFIKIDDLIRWVPNATGLWSPVNTAKVYTYGSESILNSEYKIGKNNISFNATYAYTVSKNLENNKQLFFVPFNKLTISVGYSVKKFAFYYQFLYNGFVFTRSDNDPSEVIEAYKISNIGLDYDFKFLKSSKFGFEIRNILNQKYQSVEDRPMPGRNFNMYIILKF